jgi:hypothetical protein
VLEGFNSQAARFDELLSAYTSGVHKLQQVLLELSEDVAPRCLRVLNEVCSDMCAGVRMSYSLSMPYSLFNHPDATAHLRPVSEHSFDQVLSQPNPNTLCRGGGGGEWLYGVSTPDCYQGAQTPPAPPEAAKRGGGGVCSRQRLPQHMPEPIASPPRLRLPAVPSASMPRHPFVFRYKMYTQYHRGNVCVLCNTSASLKGLSRMKVAESTKALTWENCWQLLRTIIIRIMLPPTVCGALAARLSALCLRMRLD